MHIFRPLVVLSTLVVAAGCQQRKTVVSGPTVYSFDMGVSGFELPEEGVEILYDDEGLGRVKQNAPIVRVTLPDDEYLTDTKGRLRVRVEGSCGKQDIPLRIPFADRQEEIQTVRAATAKPVVFQVETPATVRVYYDNESGPATTFTVGARAVPVAAGASGVTSIVLGSCGTSRQIVVGSVRVGELPSQAGFDAQSPMTLVDLVGGHCYRRRVRRYRPDGGEAHPDPKPKPAPKPAAKPADAGAPEKQPDDLMLKGQRVYAVGIIHDLFQFAPTSMAPSDEAVRERVELVRCDAKRPPAGATSAATPTASVAKSPPPTKTKVAPPKTPPPPAKKK